jgi:hypothetical protein
MLNFMLCNTDNLKTLQKAERFKQAIRSSPEDCAVRNQKCKINSVKKNICITLYNAHLVGILKI